MVRMKRLWVPVLVGLLVAGVLGVGGGGAVAVEPRLTTASIMIPAAAFIPTTDNWDYSTGGNYLAVSGGNSGFSAPVSFPVPVVSIKKITLYAYDNTNLSAVCASPYRANPAAATQVLQGIICTSGASTLDPQVLITTAISPRRVNTAIHGAQLWVDLGPGTKFYGVKVTYTH